MSHKPTHFLQAGLFSLLCLFLCTIMVDSLRIMPHGTQMARLINQSRNYAVPNDSLKSDKKPLHLEVVSSAILGAAPWLELHHIVVIKDPEAKKKGAYTIDFSPMNHQSPKTLMKMLLGRDVPGEIRVRWIPEDQLTLSEIKDKCMNSDSTFFQRISAKLKGVSSMGKGYQTFANIPTSSKTTTDEIEQFLYEVSQQWRQNINLYGHNCQHFSRYVKNMAKREFQIVDHHHEQFAQ